MNKEEYTKLIVKNKDGIEFIIGNKYKWDHGFECLVYLGHNWSGNGRWHQFSWVDDPKKRDVWCEVLTVDLSMMEEWYDPETSELTNDLSIGVVEVESNSQRKKRLAREFNETRGDTI